LHNEKSEICTMAILTPTFMRGLEMNPFKTFIDKIRLMIPIRGKFLINQNVQKSQNILIYRNIFVYLLKLFP